jgi:hypothetical protein
MHEEHEEPACMRRGMRRIMRCMRRIIMQSMRSHEDMRGHGPCSMRKHAAASCMRMSMRSHA